MGPLRLFVCDGELGTIKPNAWSSEETKLRSKHSCFASIANPVFKVGMRWFLGSFKLAMQLAIWFGSSPGHHRSGDLSLGQGLCSLPLPGEFNTLSHGASAHRLIAHLFF